MKVDEELSAPDGSEQPGSAEAERIDKAPASRRQRIGASIGRLTDAIRRGDDAAVEQAVLQLSKRSRWLAPLGLVVGAFLMLFQGLKLRITQRRTGHLQRRIDIHDLQCT